MDLLNGLLTKAFDLLMSPVQGLNPWIGLCLASAVVTAILLLCFKYTSRPEAIRIAKGRLIARTLELVLFQQDMFVSLSAVGRILWANLLYLKELLIPLAVALIFAIPLLSQCAAWFESRPLQIGEHALLELELASPLATSAKSQLVVPGVVQADTQPVLVQWPTERLKDKDVTRPPEVNWRVSGLTEGSGTLQIDVDGASFAKSVVVGNGLARVSRKLPPASNYWERLLYPSEAAVSSSSTVKSAELHYPLRNWYVDLPLIGFWDVNWLVAVFILSIVFGFALKKPLNVTL